MSIFVPLAAYGLCAFFIFLGIVLAALGITSKDPYSGKAAAAGIISAYLVWLLARLSGLAGTILLVIWAVMMLA